jgi:hypothetical protein
MTTLTAIPRPMTQVDEDSAPFYDDASGNGTLTQGSGQPDAGLARGNRGGSDGD